MDEILRRLTAIEALLYTITGLMLVMVTVFFALWSIVIQGRRPNIPQLFDMTTKAVKRGVYALDVKLQKRRKIKNLNNAPVIPDVDDVLLRKFARVLLQEIGQSAGIEDVKLTEAVWIVGGKFKDIVGGSPAQFKACMDRLEAERIITRSGGKNVRVWAMPYRSITSKLQRLLK